MNIKKKKLSNRLIESVESIFCMMGMHDVVEYNRPYSHHPFEHLTLKVIGNECARCGKDLSGGGEVIDSLLSNKKATLPLDLYNNTTNLY